MHGIVSVLDPFFVLSKRLQNANSGCPDIVPCVESVLRDLERDFTINPTGTFSCDPGSSCGNKFANLVCNNCKGVDSNFGIVMIEAADGRISDQLKGFDVADDTVIACMEIWDADTVAHLVMFHREDSRRSGNVPTSEDEFVECVAAIRADLAEVAAVGVASVKSRFPEDAMSIVSNSQWVNSGWWGLNGSQGDMQRSEKVDDASLEDVLGMISTLVLKFTESGQLPGVGDSAPTEVPAFLDPAVLLRNVSGLEGTADEQLCSALVDEVDKLPRFVKKWGIADTSVGEGDGEGMVEWHKFWVQLIADDKSEFCLECPIVADVLNLITVMPHGSVENERGFSGMNLVKSDMRSRFKQPNMNAALRVRDQKKKILDLKSTAWEAIVKRSLRLLNTEIDDE